MVMHNPFLKRFNEFILAPSHSRTISAVVILIIAAAVPLTVLVAQQQQQTQQHAATTSSCFRCASTCTSCYANPPCTGNTHVVCYGCGPTCEANTPAPVPTPATTAAPTPATTAAPTPPTTGCTPGSQYCTSATGFKQCVSGSTYTPYDCQTHTLNNPNGLPNYYCKDVTAPGGIPNISCILGCAARHDLGAAVACQTSCGTATSYPTYYCAGGQVCCNTACTTPQCTSTGQLQTCSGGVLGNPTSCPIAGQTCTGTSCACPTGQTNPYYTCSSNNTCIAGTANTCGANSGGCNAAGGSCGTPVCTGGVTPTPNNLFVGDTSSLSLSGCTNATTYNWTSTCGTLPSTSTSTPATTWTAPGNGPTVCTVWAYACNASGTCSPPYTAPITVNLHDCNAGLKDCTVCDPNTSTQQCHYATYNGSANCTALTWFPNVCTPNATPTPTPTPTATPSTCTNGAKQCSATGIPQTCTNGIWIDGTACTTGQICTNGTCTSTAGHTILALRIGMDGVGSTGDHNNSIPLLNWQKIPVMHKTRTIAVQVWDTNNNEVVRDQSAQVAYDSNNGYFTDNFDLGTNFIGGSYIIKVKSDGHLRKSTTGLVSITSGATNAIPQLNLVVGDLDGNNIIDIRDYNILVSCSVFASSGVSYSPNAPFDNGVLCNSNANYQTLSDLDDNGVIDQVDFNLFLIEYSVQNGD